MITSERSVNELSGILNVLKPPGMTSFDVVGYLRSLLKIKRIGHTGTLDPAAVGVLPICIGRATKAIEYLTDKDKCYRAELTLGTVTDTQDSTGTVLETCKVEVGPVEIRKTVDSFTGKYMQTPPMYSAVKVGGKKLYELARQGITIERKPREIEIYSINILDINMKNGGKKDEEGSLNQPTVLFDVECSKGAYIRTLCADIGEKLGCGGIMSFLVRMKAGVFDISSALTLETINRLVEDGRIAEKLIQVDTVFSGLKSITLTGAHEKKVLNGAVAEIDSSLFNTGETVRMYNTDNVFLGLGRVLTGQGNLLLKHEKLF